MSSEIATSIPREETRQRIVRRPSKTLAVQLIGPLTIFAGFVWAVAQPYRIVLLDPEGHSIYDYIVQPPLLVVLVGLLFTFVVAPGLVEDLEFEETHGPAR